MPDDLSGVEKDGETGSILEESLEKEGYAASDSPDNLEPGEYFISKKEKEKDKLHIRLLLNSADLTREIEISKPFHRFNRWIYRILQSRLSSEIGAAVRF